MGYSTDQIMEMLIDRISKDDGSIRISLNGDPTNGNAIAVATIQDGERILTAIITTQNDSLWSCCLMIDGFPTDITPVFDWRIARSLMDIIFEKIGHNWVASITQVFGQVLEPCLQA